MAEAVRKLDYKVDYMESNTANLKVHKKNNNKLISKKVKKRNIFLKMFYLLFIISSIASALLILSNYEKITSLNVEIRKINAIISESEKSEMNLNAKIEEIKSNRNIVEEAKTKLGMTYPESNQVIYFTLKDSEVENNPSIISSIFSTLTGNRE